MKKRYYITALLMGFTFLMSCVKEQDREDCPPDGIDGVNSRELMFRLKPAKYSFPNQVELLKLYLYDDPENILVDTKFVPLDELIENDYKVNLDDWINWQEEAHHIVAVMNLTDHYEITGDRTLSTLQTNILATSQDSVLNKIGDTFIGYYQLDPANTRATVMRDTMQLEKLTNHIYVTVEFRGYSFPDDHQLVSHIRGSNATYDYLNKCNNSSTLTYMPHKQNSEGSRIYSFDLTTGKLFIGDDLIFCLQHYDKNGALIAQNSLNLTDEIISLTDGNGNYIYDTQEELEEEDEFYLNFILDDQFAIVELRINNWYTVNPGVDL